MRSYRISEIIYWVISVLSVYQSIVQWNSDPQKAYIFLGFAALSIFMALFRRHYRKKFENRRPPEA
ncbi:MAG: hypothetical protein ACPHL7_04130 [Flavobacteriaceae bacterium]|jgi:uncharacterized membrane protein YuzA (DUF378 family)